MTLTDRDVAAFMPRIRQAARRLIGRGCPRAEHDDLVAVGLGALVAAANDYDPAAGAKFETYADTRIRGAMLHWWRDRCLLIRLPNSVIADWKSQPRAVTCEELPDRAGAESVNVDLAALRIALDSLPADQRQLVIGHYLEGRTHHELAGPLGLTQMGVCHRLRRALRILRKLMGG
jgi:RNA polymerase sigma factor (sigma-70 family)